MTSNFEKHLRFLRWVAHHPFKFSIYATLFFAISFGSIFAVIHYSIKHSGLYKLATRAVMADSRVIAELGEPVKFGFLVTGEISTHGRGGGGELSFGVIGSNQNGDVVVRGVKEGDWKLTTLKVLLADERTIDIVHDD